MDNSSSCPAPDALLNFARGNLSPADAQGVQQHLEHCARCLASLPKLLAKESDPTINQRVGTDPDVIVATLAETKSAPANGESPSAAQPSSFVLNHGAPFPFFSPAVNPDEIGRLGSYRVLSLLGRGGMGLVFHAEDIALGRPVALKVMKPGIESGLEPWQRFLREARLLAAVKHANVVTLYQVGSEGEVIYLAMEFLEGQTLDEWLRSGRAPTTGEIVRFGRQIANGLAAIHKQGLVHRDIKPANIWLEAPEEHVKILDFGLALSVEDDSRLTQTGMVVGTPAFMSPEQARGDKLDSRSDLFSLGCLLYLLCTGTEPFTGRTPMAQLSSLALDEATPIQQLNPLAPDDLSDLVMTLLSKHPEERPASAIEVATMLKQIEASLTNPRHPAPTARSATAKTRPISLKRTTKSNSHVWRTRAMVLIVVLLVVAAFAGGAVALLLIDPSRHTVEESSAFLRDWTPVDKVDWPIPPPPGAPEFFAIISVRSKRYEHGIGMHASPHGLASLSFALRKNYAKFSTSVSINDSARPDPTPLTFSIYGDDKLLWQFKEVSSQDDTQSKTVSVAGVDILKLTVTSNGDSRGAHGVWLDPVVERAK